MKIGIDLDNTLVNLQVEISKLAARYGVNYCPQNWNFEDYPEDVQKELWKMFKNPAVMCNLNPIPGAIDKISKWKELGHEMIVITARNDLISRETEEFVDGLFGLPCIVVGSSDKELILKESNLSIWIDDSPKNVLVAKALGIPTIMISNDETPYNHYIRSEVPWVESIVDINLE